MLNRGWQDLSARVAAEADLPVASDISRVGDVVRQRHRGAAAILAYGSCIRGVSTSDSLIDLYVLVRHPGDVSNHPLLRLACRWLPPNVHFVALEEGGEKLRCKYAILCLDDFRRRMTSRNPYFWARFAQPVRLLHSADEAARATVLDALAQACLTMLRESRYLARSGEDVPAAVARCLTMTYATELRAERSDRASGIVHANTEFYRDVADLAAHVDANESMQSPRFHGVRKLAGKLLSVARLVKASFTFEGGMDYLSWKIERHSGQRIELSDWQRRHPIIAGILLLRRLRKSGAVR